ncbi:MAG: hypothetical protein SCALA702_24150 [Melioribacteraceae bacterium]|nr:MAG: hypothetical protein SCALA702_24150 [Melioribacteraceae bacterium]
MKKILVLLLIIFAGTTLAQNSFYVDVHNMSCIDTVGSEMVFQVEVTNTSSSDLTLAFVRTGNDIPTGWLSSFCFELCFPDFIDSVATTSDFLSSPLTPGETREFSVHVFALQNSGTGQVDVKIMDLNDPQDNSIYSFYSTTEVAQGAHAFTFETQQTELTDTTGAEIVFEFDIHNTSPVPLVLEFNKANNAMPDGWFSSLCLDVCFPDFIDTVTTSSEFGSSPIQPDETREFSVHVFTNENEGTAEVSINAINTFAADDSYSMTLTAHAEEPITSNTFAIAGDFTTQTDTLGSEIVYNIEIENTSDAPVTMDIVRTVNDLPADWTSSLCFDVCFPPDLDSISTTSNFASSPIQPGETRELSLHFFPMNNTGTGSVELVIKDHDHPQLSETINVSASAVITSFENMVDELNYRLNQNYPNPFNPSTMINFSIKEAGFTKLAVYDILGREIALLIDGHLEAGSHSVSFDASNFTSGVYLYRISSGDFNETKKMILEK